MECQAGLEVPHDATGGGTDGTFLGIEASPHSDSSMFVAGRRYSISRSIFSGQGVTDVMMESQPAGESPLGGQGQGFVGCTRLAGGSVRRLCRRSRRTLWRGPSHAGFGLQPDSRSDPTGISWRLAVRHSQASRWRNNSSALSRRRSRYGPRSPCAPTLANPPEKETLCQRRLESESGDRKPVWRSGKPGDRSLLHKGDPMIEVEVDIAMRDGAMNSFGRALFP